MCIFCYNWWITILLVYLTFKMDSWVHYHWAECGSIRFYLFVSLDSIFGKKTTIFSAQIWDRRLWITEIFKNVEGLTYNDLLIRHGGWTCGYSINPLHSSSYSLMLDVSFGGLLTFATIFGVLLSTFHLQ